MNKCLNCLFFRLTVHAGEDSLGECLHNHLCRTEIDAVRSKGITRKPTKGENWTERPDLLISPHYGCIHWQVRLQPCPFCGSEALEVDSRKDVVTCSDCKAVGPSWKIQGSYAERWNTRID